MVMKKLTDAKLLILGLLSERKRHAYELEKVIEDRGMREWTDIGFSSIYYILKELENQGLVKSSKSSSSRDKKTISLSPLGRKELRKQTELALSEIRANTSSILLGMINWQCLPNVDAIKSLEARTISIKNELSRLENVLYQNQPFPDFIELLFNFSKGQLESELEWVESTLEYMKSKSIQTERL